MFQLSLANCQFELDRQDCKDVSLQEGRGFDIVQLKYDGIWGGLVSHEPNFLTVYSRNGLVKSQWLVPNLPPDCVFAGEFMFGSQWAQHPNRKGKAFVYDCLVFHGEDIRKRTYKERLTIALETIIPLKHDFLQVVASSGTSNIEERFRLLETTRSYEGFVFRRWDDPYDAKCGRIKIDVEEDYVVLRVNPGEGKHRGRMGSLTVGQYRANGELIEIMDVGGGFSDLERENHPAVGTVILVRGKAKFTSGALRHPNFVRVRDDKNRFECLFVEPTT